MKRDLRVCFTQLCFIKVSKYSERENRKPLLKRERESLLTNRRIKLFDNAKEEYAIRISAYSQLSILDTSFDLELLRYIPRSRSLFQKLVLNLVYF